MRGGRAQLAEERRQWQAVDATLRGIWQALSLDVPASHPASAAPLPRGP
jgi:PadR family transcriptional regulator, regulatory protein PadR